MENNNIAAFSTLDIRGRLSFVRNLPARIMLQLSGGFPRGGANIPAQYSRENVIREARNKYIREQLEPIAEMHAPENTPDVTSHDPLSPETVKAVVQGMARSASSGNTEGFDSPVSEGLSRSSSQAVFDVPNRYEFSFAHVANSPDEVIKLHLLSKFLEFEPWRMKMTHDLIQSEFKSIIQKYPTAWETLSPAKMRHITQTALSENVYNQAFKNFMHLRFNELSAMPEYDVLQTCRAFSWESSAQFVKHRFNEWQELTHEQMEETVKALNTDETCRDFIAQRFPEWKQLQAGQMKATIGGFKNGKISGDFIAQRFPEWSALSERQMKSTAYTLQKSKNTREFITENFSEWRQLTDEQMGGTRQAMRQSNEMKENIIANFSIWKTLSPECMHETVQNFTHNPAEKRKMQSNFLQYITNIQQLNLP